MNKLEATFTFERDTKNTRRYQEMAGDSPPICGTIYLQKWAIKRLADGGALPERVRVTVAVDGDPA